MIHFLGINIDANKDLPHALSSVYGIGNSRINEICAYLGVSKKLKFYELNETQLSKMSRIIEQHYLIESELRKHQTYNLKRLLDVKSYRGLRHVNGLPVRGQRTHTNAKTQKSLSKRRNIKNVT